MSDQQIANSIVDSLDAGILVLDVEYRVVFWNSWLENCSGIASAEARGRKLQELFPRRPLQRVLTAAGMALRSGTSSLVTHSLHPGLFPLRTPAGKALTHDVIVRAIGQRPFRYCLFQITDVTVAVERETVLRKRQNARYDAVVDSAPDVILTLDAEGIIQFANPAVMQQFGYSPQELVGRPSRMLFQSADDWDAIWRPALAGGKPHYPSQMVAIRKDGSSSYMEASVSRWLSDTRILVSVILRDVNERRQILEKLRDLNATLEQRVAERTSELMQTEEALRQSQKMEAVGQLTGGIAHDFNNLLQGIIGAIERVKRNIQDGETEDVTRFLDGALTSANRAAALTSRLLSFSRRHPQDPRPLDVGQLVGAMDELLQRSVGGEFDLKIRACSDLWLVRCDANQLENALLNLAINARDAMPDGGAISIDIANVVLDGPAARQREISPGDYVRIRVHDTGAGMPPDVKARVFEPFYTTKPIGQGTGLGLSMTYGFVRQSDGSIQIESYVGKGTTVEICLPRYRGEVDVGVAEEKRSAGPLKSGKEAVLVVEDEALIRLLIVDTLNDLGCHVLEAGDGPSALRILQSSEPIDLLVSDIGLPGLNGRQLADAARVARPNLRVLFMTGYAENAQGTSFLEEGMEIITKPFTTNDLAERIQSIIEGQ